MRARLGEVYQYHSDHNHIALVVRLFGRDLQYCDILFLRTGLMSITASSHFPSSIWDLLL